MSAILSGFWGVFGCTDWTFVLFECLEEVQITFNGIMNFDPIRSFGSIVKVL